MAKTSEIFSMDIHPYKVIIRSGDNEMIYGSTNHPVLVKKIALNVWRLRDEIIALVEKEVSAGGQSNLSGIATSYKAEYKGEDAPTTGSEEQEKPANAGSEEAAKSDSNTAASSDEADEQGPADAENSAEKPEAKAEEEQAETPSPQVAEVASPQPTAEKKKSGKVDNEKNFKARTILAEIYMNKMFLFCSEKFIVGQSIVIEFDIPKPFIMNAEVSYCREFNMKSRIISDKKMPYRAAANFTFVKEGERDSLRNFLKSIEPDLESEKKDSEKSKESAPQAAEDNFEDLDI